MTELRNKLRDKLRAARGFSMVEMLLTCAMLMVAVGLTGQMLANGAVGTRNVTRENAAQILCRDISEAVRDQLAYVTFIEGSAYSSAGGVKSYPQPNFISSAVTVQGVPGQFGMMTASGAYSTSDYGSVVIRFPMGSGRYYDYYPVNSGNYNGDGDDGYAAKVEYTYYPDYQRFDVTVSVRYYVMHGGSSDGRQTRYLTDSFIVVPMIDGVTVTNTNPFA